MSGGPEGIAFGLLEWLPAVSAAISGIALTMTCVNLPLYARSRAVARGAAVPPADAARAPRLSICIPARNEAANIQAVVRSALANDDVALEVLVYDDQSTDDTPRLLAELVAADPRVRAVPTQPLPTGWNGKQWGCERMGHAARGEWMLFTDADVRVTPDCFARALATAGELKAELLSTVPREETGTFLEKLVVPLIHWMLLGWLPIPRMRTTNDPATSAGCGQFLLVRREAWHAAGRHEAFRDSMHDGIKLPRNLRRAGLHTDLFDGTDVVSCRMYRDAGQTWRGFTKNAYEGLGSPVVLAVFTFIEVVGILLPWVWLPCALVVGGVGMGPIVLACFAILAQLVQRVLLAVRFRQSWLCVVLHPLTIATLMAIQWRSWWLHRTGRRAWKGRSTQPG